MLNFLSIYYVHNIKVATNLKKYSYVYHINKKKKMKFLYINQQFSFLKAFKFFITHTHLL